ncbi:MAG: hypothetical protein ACRDYU_07460 [Actinomycetes bacterium]
MSLSKDQILSADDLDVRKEEVPEWGGTVLVKALSGKERDAYEASVVQMRQDARGNQTTVPDMRNVRAKLVARALVDEDGTRLFADQDINALGAKSARVLDRLFDVAAEMSGLSEQDVEKLAGNSEAVPSDGSTSSSPETSDAASESSSDGSAPTS